jgi:hypothetical protein
MSSLMDNANGSEHEAAQALLLMVRASLAPFHAAHDWREGSSIQGARSAAANGKYVLLVGGLDSVLLSPDGLDRWLREYHVDLPFSLSGDPANDDEARRGIGWVLRAGPPGRELSSEAELDANDPVHQIIAREYVRATRG